MKIYVKDFAGKTVSEIEVTPTTERNHERFMSGLLMKVDTDRFFVDDSEVDEYFAEGATK
jgi:hypothetical protein